MSLLRCLVGLMVVLMLWGVCGCAGPKAESWADAYSAQQHGFGLGGSMRGGMGGGGGGYAYSLDVPAVDLDGDGIPEVPELPTAQLAADVDEARAAEQRVLVYSGALSVLVADPDAAVKDTETLAAEVGGYVERIEGSEITIRIPAAKFNDAMDRISTLGHVAERSIEASDVTETYRDLRLRLRSAEAVLERLLQILEKAESVEELLAVEKEIGRNREEIERLKGQIRLLERKIAYSAITVEFAPVQEARAEDLMPESPFPWLDQLTVEHVLRMRPARLPPGALGGHGDPSAW
ncbi:MAG: DUF4349 domain-containing protein [Phycisphaerae bacterium]|nr:DUF4349 domain-containing protein [Phycisphaerae bacterium]